MTASKSQTRLIILMGARASGKSSIGRAIAARLGLPFLDLDELVLARFEQDSVRAVWAVHGESGWREMEQAVLFEALDQPAGVIALGGGTPMIQSARTALENATMLGRAAIVYLEADPETLTARLAAQTGDRPSLTGRPAAEEIADVLRERESTYRELATLTVRTDRRAVEDAADVIVGRLRSARPE